MCQNIKVFEEEGIFVENERWGPFIKVNKKNVKIPTKKDGEKYTAEELKEVNLVTYIKWIEAVDASLLKKSARKLKKRRRKQQKNLLLRKNKNRAIV